MSNGGNYVQFIVAVLGLNCAVMAAGADAVTFDRDIRPLLAKYCFDCHGQRKQKADLNFASFTSPKAIQRARDPWLKAWQALHTREMPPDDSPQPTLAQRELLADWIERTLNDIDCEGEKDPGRVVIRRLTRYEYRNTIRDLVGVDFYPAADFPADDVGYGFDNIGDVLSLPPLLMEKYLSAAESILDEAIVIDAAPAKLHFPAQDLPSTAAGRADMGERWLSTNGQLYTDVEIAKPGRYLLRTRAWGTAAGGGPPRISLNFGGRELRVFDVSTARSEPGVYEAELLAEPGQHRLAVAFTNDYWDPKHPDPSQRDRNLVVQYVELVGPLEEKGAAPESHRRIFDLGGSTPASKRATAAAIVERFARRAFRRPVSAAEVKRYVRLLETSDSSEPFEQAMKLPLAAVLVSPHFLFRVEADASSSQAAVAPVGDYELAARLSYFLWSSMPDDELFALAAQGKLRDDRVLEGQVRRMLADPKAYALAENFATQWLALRRLDSISPDTTRFTAYTPELRDAMYAEVVGWFDLIRREDRSLLELIDAEDVLVNELLAAHYGITGVTGPELRRIKLPPQMRGVRGGILTSAAVLTVTSNPSRTNPTRRGKWVLETVLGTPPPPPVPDVGELEDVAPADAMLSLRQRLELHRSDPNCAGCHSRMDPIGFAFERFDAVGAWRETEEGRPIDDSGVLPGGLAFAGPIELKNLLLARREDFARALAEKMLTYALGRGLEYYDVCAVREVTKPLAADGYRFSTLVVEVARSYPFRHRRTAAFRDEVIP